MSSQHSDKFKKFVNFCQEESNIFGIKNHGNQFRINLVITNKTFIKWCMV